MIPQQNGLTRIISGENRCRVFFTRSANCDSRFYQKGFNSLQTEVWLPENRKRATSHPRYSKHVLSALKSDESFLHAAIIFHSFSASTKPRNSPPPFIVQQSKRVFKGKQTINYSARTTFPFSRKTVASMCHNKFKSIQRRWWWEAVNCFAPLGVVRKFQMSGLCATFANEDEFANSWWWHTANTPSTVLALKFA